MQNSGQKYQIDYEKPNFADKTSGVVLSKKEGGWEEKAWGQLGFSNREATARVAKVIIPTPKFQELSHPVLVQAPPSSHPFYFKLGMC